MVHSSTGDLGDSVVTLGIVKGIPNGPHDFILRQSTATKMKHPLDVKRWHAMLAPLAEAQPYIRECRIAKPDEPADWDSGNFRNTGLHSRSASLFNAQLSHLRRYKGIGHDITPNDPWLTVEPSPETADRVVVARSGRYRNGAFPWQQIVDFYGDRLLFIGMPHEWAEFGGHFGLVEHRPVKNFLEVAELIAGSLLFIGNQSSPMTVCEGLKHRCIQETSTDPADCIYLRDNAQWCYNGEVTLPGFDKDDLHLRAVNVTPRMPSTVTTPPQQWQYGDKKSYAFDALLSMVRKESPGVDPQELLGRILQANVLRCPEFFMNSGAISAYKRVEMARQNAGYPPRDTKAIIGI